MSSYEYRMSISNAVRVLYAYSLQPVLINQRCSYDEYEWSRVYSYISILLTHIYSKISWVLMSMVWVFRMLYAYSLQPVLINQRCSYGEYEWSRVCSYILILLTHLYSKISWVLMSMVWVFRMLYECCTHTHCNLFL